MDEFTTILVTGATGQIGVELTAYLRERYGAENVVAAGHHKSPEPAMLAAGPFCFLDVTETQQLEAVVQQKRVGCIYHLASLLSAVAESKPKLAWDININGLINVLETARKYQCSVFFPSSIGAFGPETPELATPQVTIQRPTTMYGISKVSGELLCDYYFNRYQVDTRGLRFPGLISHTHMPGGGTTDYAVDIFYAALKDQHYQCFLSADTRLDMMYMPDAINAAVQLMEADVEKLIHRNAFNVTAMSFTPQQLADAITRHIPNFSISYQVDPVRQGIADSWPRHMDDSAATQEWGWQPRYDLSMMVSDMLEKIAAKMAAHKTEGEKLCR